jgi:RNA polymerase nonessential primary-like sigma factor
MPSTPFYLETENDNVPSDEHLRLTETGELPEQLANDLAELEQEETSTAHAIGNPTRSTTDLVRLYLSEIGRVPLLRRDEEVSEAQKVQRQIHLLHLQRQVASDGDEVMQRFVKLNDAQEKLVCQLSHRPSLERWAATAGMDVAELKQTLKVGKQRWAEAAGLTVTELEQLLKAGNQAKEHMIQANLRLVVSVAKKYQNRGLELLDLIQEGSLGLERAVEKFDPKKGYRFSTYAYWWIRQGITRAIASQSRTIRLPVHITEKLNKIKKAQRKISQEKGCTPTVEDIARELSMPPSQVRDILARVPQSVSLEIKVGKERDTELGELLETDGVAPEDLLAREALQKDVQHLLTDLTSREQDVIQMRYGINDGHPHSLAEIGRALNLSRERVRQIECKAMQKLQQPKRRSQVRDYLDFLS